MVIIIAATEVDQELDSLINQYDNAKSPEQQEQVAAELFKLVGSQIRSMISFASKGRQLSAEELDGLAMQALYRGLNESGMPRFKLQSAADRDWQPQIQQMMSAARTFKPSPAARIWSMIPSRTQSAILANSQYITASVQNQFVADLNALLRRRDLFTPLLWHWDSLPREARELVSQGIENLSSSNLARLNSSLIASAFSGVVIPDPPKRNLLGYIARSVVPQLKPQIWESATGRRTDLTLVEAWNALKDDFAAVEQMRATGTMPDEWESLPFAEQILKHNRQRITARFGPVIKWWNQQIIELQPDSRFVVHDRATLREARELFEENRDRIPEELWKSTDSKFYLPTRAFQKYGRATIERLLATEGFGRRGAPMLSTVAPPMQRQPSKPTASESEAMGLLKGGHQSPAYRWLLDQFFSAPGFEAEQAVGVFLTSASTPSNQQIQGFLESLPEDLAEQIESVGFRNLARQIDARMLEEIKKPEVQSELQSVLGQQRMVSAAIIAIRRNVFLRTADLIRSQCA